MSDGLDSDAFVDFRKKPASGVERPESVLSGVGSLSDLLNAEVALCSMLTDAERGLPLPFESGSSDREGDGVDALIV